MTLWWGTYPADGLGSPAGLGEGIWRSGAPDSMQAVQELEIPAPSFLVAHPTLPLLYVASETGDSRVAVVDVRRPAAPRIVATLSTGGADACHLLLARDARTLYVAHYTSGDLAVVRLGEDGGFLDGEAAQLFGHEGSGPRADRQERPHAHSALVAPGERHVLVADLGTDELRRYRLRPDGLLDADGVAATLPPGAGPRHVAVRGHLLYVACELDHTLRTLRWDGGTATAEVIAASPSTLVGPRSADLQDSHVALVPGHTGDVLLVGVRGADVIAVHDVAPEGELTYRGAFDAGHWPRHFAALGDRLVVGEERGHRVRSFALADVIGLPPEPEAGAVVDLPCLVGEVTSPACVVEA